MLYVDKMSSLVNHSEIALGIPKAELHIHIEGSLEPEMVMKLAKKHNKQMYDNLEELKGKYKFKSLADFLNLYYQNCAILLDQDDFSELIYEYLKKAHSQGLKYAEIFFDPQTHTDRGVKFDTVIKGLLRGLAQAKAELKDLDAQLIMCFLRDHSEEAALKILEESLQYRDHILGIGLDSNEIDNPPEKFKRVYARAKELKWRLVAHAGEECSISTDYIRQALDVLNVERIDHGVQCIKSEEIMKEVALRRIPLTVCPFSNVRLQVHQSVKETPLLEFTKRGIICSINSDDPSYFGGYIGDNYLEVGRLFDFEIKDYEFYARNSFISSFLDEKRKESYCKSIEEFTQKFK